MSLDEALVEGTLKPDDTLEREERLAKRLQHAIQQLHGCVDVTPAIRGGIPVVKGTRFTVAQVLAELAEGRSIAELADDFDLDVDCLKNLLHSFAICLDRA
jgi:uncharacterized protein (DUF433 family)